MIQVLGIGILVSFYSIYIGKIIVQRRKGIQTDQMAKGKKEKKLLIIEGTMKAATYSLVGVQVLSIVLRGMHIPTVARLMGISIGVVGVSIFGIAVYSMRDSWCAGIPEKKETTMVTEGIYSISRNPAFLGFDLSYIGLLIAFYNEVLLIWTLFTIVMFHIQILQEEKYLATVFGKEYACYKQKVGRYIGRKLKVG